MSLDKRRMSKSSDNLANLKKVHFHFYFISMNNIN